MRTAGAEIRGTDRDVGGLGQLVAGREFRLGGIGGRHFAQVVIEVESILERADLLGVAHGADWLMQLALNPLIGHPETELIESAIAAQAAPGAHAYIHGESERLARPLLFLARREDVAGRDWTEYFRVLSDPAPLGGWEAAFGSEAGLARLHNLKAFLGAVHLGAATSGDPALLPLSTASLQALKALP